MKYKFNCKVIICGAAVGKTYLAEHDNRFIDVDELKANYKYGLSNKNRQELEQGKLNRGQVINKDSTEYAIKILNNEIKNNHIVLVSSGNKGLIKYIHENRIPYCLVYPGKDLLTEYTERMKKRGNVSAFIEKMANREYWEKCFIENENDSRPTYKIELKKGQYLYDIKEYFV